MTEEMEKQLQEELDQLTWEEAQEEEEEVVETENPYLEFGICESDFH